MGARSSARFFAHCVFVFGLAAATAAQAGPAAGVVTDASGGALARARVRLVDASGAEKAATLTDERGRFTIDVTACGGCRMEATLTGFKSASIAVSAVDAAARDFHPALALALAPIADAIVVTPTRDAAPAEQVGANITVFTADDINRRGALMISDVLREAPGVAVIQSGGTGSQTSLFLRGGESSYTKVLLDGVPLNEPGGTFNFANLTTDNIARVELVRGAQSALFGSDAMAGVVQLFTARGAAGPTPAVKAAFETGTYATNRGTASVSGGGAGWDYNVGAAGGVTDNRVPNNKFTNNTVSWSAGRDVAPGVTLRTIGRVEYGKVGTPGQTAFGRPDMDASYEHRDAVAGVSLAQRLTAHWTQRASYSFTRSRQTSTNLIADPDYVPTYGAATAPYAFSDYTFQSENVLRRHVFNYQSDWTIPGAATQIVTAAADIDAERGDLKDLLAKTTVQASRNNIGVTVQHQLVGRWGSLVTSGRVEHNNSFGNKFVPRVSGALVLHQGTGTVGATSLKANAGLGVKEPTLLQSFSPNAYYLGNPNLLPEQSRTVDLGVSQRVANDRGRVELVYFDNRYKNIISTRTTDFTTFAAQYFNIGTTTAKGVELTGDAVLARVLRVGGGYTWLDSAIVDSTSPSSTVLKAGNWAFRRPRHSAFVRAGLTQGRVTADLDGQYTGHRVDSDFSSLAPAIIESGAYWVWNASATLTVRQGVQIFGRVQNIGDVDYMEPLGYQAWRRTVHVGLRVGF